MLPRLPATVLFMAVFVAAAVRLLDTAAAQTALVPTQDAASLLGGERAQGAVIWSHGRSLETECSLAPTPEYIGAFRAAGWDTFRLNRPRAGDTQPVSGAALAEAADALKHRGYRRVVLAGQSFGAFAQNATGLYDLLGAVRRARVALFFFEGDVFDPGGRGPVVDQILAAHGLTHVVVDRPAGLPTHWAAAGTAFATEYASCLVAFAAGDLGASTLDCRTQVAAVHIGGTEGASPPVLTRLTPVLHENSASVIDLKIGGRVDV